MPKIVILRIGNAHERMEIKDKGFSVDRLELA